MKACMDHLSTIVNNEARGMAAYTFDISKLVISRLLLLPKSLRIPPQRSIIVPPSHLNLY